MQFALIFDMDGVIVDNDTYHVQAWQAFAKNHGKQLTADYYHREINGRPMRDCLRIILERSIAPDEVDALGNQKEALYRKLYAPYLSPTPGLLPFLDRLDAAGIPYAVATSAPPENVDFTLDGLGIRHRFRQVIDAKGVTHGKPHPEVYLKSAERMGFAPKDCIVLEDAQKGIEAGKRAGMLVVGVATTQPEATLRAADVTPDRVIRDFSDLRPETLAAWLAD